MKLTFEQYTALTEWVEALISKRLEEAFHRDYLHESIEEAHCKEVLKNTILGNLDD